MAEKPLILHVGMHKTGTTAIQASLAANRAWLQSEGVEYPEAPALLRGPRTAHHGVARALAEPTLRRRIALFRFRRRIERAAQDARLTVISAEPIFRHRVGTESDDTAAFVQGHRAYLRQLAHYFRNFAPTVLLYLRRPDTFVVSLYKTGVARGDQTPDFEDFAKAATWWVIYPERLAVFREVFGQLEVLTYESEREAGLLTRFYAMLGLPSPPHDSDPELRVSPSNRATLWLRRAQQEAPRSRREHGFRVIFATSEAGAPLFHEQGPSTLWPSDEALNAFVAQHRAAYETGGFTIPNISGTPRTVWTDAMHADAEAAFAEWEHANKEALLDRARRGLAHYEDR